LIPGLFLIIKYYLVLDAFSKDNKKKR